MKRYDPEIAPDGEEWLELDEGARQALVEDFHRKARIRLPNRTVHASMHVAVENQVAMGDDLPVAKIIDRLLGEGLDRHDALHAVASVLWEHLFNLMTRGQSAGEDPNAPYYQALSRLTAASWRSGSHLDNPPARPPPPPGGIPARSSPRRAPRRRSP
jgi:Domain of unknown function (DUF1841)